MTAQVGHHEDLVALGKDPSVDRIRHADEERPRQKAVNKVERQHAFDAALAPFDGKVVAVDAHPVILEGAWPYPRTVLIRFASQAEAKRWYDSAEYQRICQHRWRSASVNLVLIEGRE